MKVLYISMQASGSILLTLNFLLHICRDAISNHNGESFFKRMKRAIYDNKTMVDGGEAGDSEIEKITKEGSAVELILLILSLIFIVIGYAGSLTVINDSVMSGCIIVEFFAFCCGFVLLAFGIAYLIARRLP